MREDDELLPPPVEDTITLLVKAARRAGFDVEPEAGHAVAFEPGAHGNLRSHLRAMVIAGLAGRPCTRRPVGGSAGRD